MKKIALAPLLISAAFLFSPIFASAQVNSSGCASVGGSCTVGGLHGTCAASPEGFYCLTTTSTGAPGSVNTTYLEGYKGSIIGIINGILVPILVAIAFLVFIWGAYKYFILGATNESEKGEGRKFAMWGIIGFVIIFSVWGLVRMVKITLNLDQAGSTVPAYPRL